MINGWLMGWFTGDFRCSMGFSGDFFMGFSGGDILVFSLDQLNGI